MKAVDFLARQEAGEHRAPVSLYVAGRVGVEVAAGAGEVQDLPQESKTVIGIAGGGVAEIVEPAPDLGRSDAVEPLRAEGRQDAGVEQGPEALPGRRLVSVEVGLIPLASDEVAQQGNGTLGSGPVLRFRRGLPGEARLARLGDARGLHRAERHASRSVRVLPQEDPAHSAGGSDPDPEPAHCGIPGSIFPLAGPQARHGGVSKAYAFRSYHGLFPERRADDFGGIGDHAVGEVGVLESGLGARMTGQASDGENGHALPERDAGVGVSYIM